MKRRPHVVNGLRAAAAVLALLAGGFVPMIVGAPPASATANIPTQYLAKTYTEILGRSPDPTGWNNGVSFFAQNGCTAQTLQSFGTGMFNSAEFGNTGYTNPEKVIVAFRAILNRDAEPSAYASYRDLLNSQGMPAMLSSLYSSPEFANLATSICGNNADYGFGATFPSPTPDTGTPGPAKTQVDLQNLLNGQQPGAVVTLSRRDLYVLNDQVTVPTGVTLITGDAPGTAGYARMARLIRGPYYPDNRAGRNALVILQPGAKLQRVWVDGWGGQGRCGNNQTAPVEMFGGANTTVTESRVSNTCAGTNISVLDANVGVAGITPCSDSAPNVVSWNLIEAYSSNHVAGQQADGISVHCRNTNVLFNHVVDATDGGIVLFGWKAFTQKSQVLNNRIVNAGQSAWYGMVADAQGTQNDSSHAADPPNTVSVWFTNAHMDNNMLWTSNRAHMDTVLSVGSHDLFGSSGPAGAWGGTGFSGAGITVNGNSSGGNLTRTQMAIYVGGMHYATVQNNAFDNVVREGGGACPKPAENVVVVPGYSAFLALSSGQAFWTDGNGTTRPQSNRCVTNPF